MGSWINKRVWHVRFVAYFLALQDASGSAEPDDASPCV
jgi:hypothetical protein